MQANTAMEQMGLTEATSWQGSIAGALTSFNPDSIFDNIIHGAVYWLPIYIVTFVVGGFWKCCLR